MENINVNQNVEDESALINVEENSSSNESKTEDEPKTVQQRSMPDLNADSPNRASLRKR